MDTSRTSVIGTFSDLSAAQRAVDELQSCGYSSSEVRLIANDQVESNTTSNNSFGSSESSATWTRDHPDHKGGIMNFFSRLFGLDDADDKVDRSNYHRTSSYDDESRRYFEDYYQQRRHLVIVNAARDRAETVRILESCGAMVEDRASKLYDQELERSGRTFGMNNEQVMRLREEELRTHKETVQTGEVALRKEVITETKSIEVPVSREEVVIERHRLSESEVAGHEGEILASSDREEIRIPVSEERVIVDKKVVPREEVTVSTRRVEGTERVSEDVKREEIRVEREGQVAMEGERGRDSIGDDMAPIDFDRPQDERLAKDKNKTRPAGSRPFV